MKAVLDIYLISDIASYDTFVRSDVYNAIQHHAHSLVWLTG